MSHVAVHPHLDILSICTGGGGLDLGVELAIPSARSVVLVEREAFAVAQLVSAMETGLLHQAPVWSDAKSFDGLRWRGCVDGLIGGIPCQGHSLAGKKRGSLDERDLWSPARRIIVQSRPWFVLIENVGGMLSPGDDDIAGAERVRRDLLKLGFSVEGGLFTAAEVGASHERERIFILGVADTTDGRCEHGSRLAGVCRNEIGNLSIPQFGSRCEDMADTYSERLEGQRSNAGTQGWGDARGPVGLRDGTALVHARRSERGPLSRSAEHAYREEGGREQAASRSGKSSSGMADADIVEFRREPSAREFEVDERHAGLGVFPPGPSDLSGWRGILERAPELEPAFRRVADGLASRLDIARVDRLRMLGNGVVPLQAAYAVRTLATRLADRGSAGATSLVRMMTA